MSTPSVTMSGFLSPFFLIRPGSCLTLPGPWMTLLSCQGTRYMEYAITVLSIPSSGFLKGNI